MRKSLRWVPATVGAVASMLAVAPAAMAANAADCPNGGEVRFGVEPYDTSAKLVPIYDHIAKVLADKLGCEVKVYVTTTYNAEIEAMRNGKLEIGESSRTSTPRACRSRAGRRLRRRRSRTSARR